MTLTIFRDLAQRSIQNYYSQLASIDVANKHVVVIGYGSIGQRITKILESSGVNVSIISRHHAIDSRVSRAFQESHLSSDMTVIATETNDHLNQLLMLSKFNYSGLIYIEKPVLSSSREVDIISKLSLPTFRSRVYCGYNFRYHLLTAIVRDFLSEFNTDVFVKYIYNENVKTWNKSIPWHQSYATSPTGGGAVLTLSHAIDQLRHLISEPVSFERLFFLPTLLQTMSNEGVLARVTSSVSTNSFDGLVEIGYHTYPGIHSLSVNTASFSLDADFKKEKLIIGDSDSTTYECLDFPNLRNLSIYKSLMTLLSKSCHSCNFMEASSTLLECERLLS